MKKKKLIKRIDNLEAEIQAKAGVMVDNLNSILVETISMFEELKDVVKEIKDV